MKKKKYAVLGIVIFLFVVAYFQKTGFSSSKTTINHIALPDISPADHVRGNSHADMTVIEYSDFECPDCQYFQPTARQLVTVYSQKIRWVVRPYPLPQHKNAEKEAEAAECVALLGGNNSYWKFNDLLFVKEKVTDDGTGFPISNLNNLAKQSGVAVQKFASCLSSGKFASYVATIEQDAAKAGINQLPSLIIIDKTGNMQLIVGNQPIGVFKSIMNNALKQ